MKTEQYMLRRYVINWTLLKCCVFSSGIQNKFKMRYFYLFIYDLYTSLVKYILKDLHRFSIMSARARKTCSQILRTGQVKNYRYSDFSSSLNSSKIFLFLQISDKFSEKS